MKNQMLTIITVFILLSMLAANNTFAQKDSVSGYFIESEKEIEKKEAGPHTGGGNSIAYRFFEKTPGSTLQLTRRVLEKGAAIGYHLQKEEEIYYVLCGSGEMKMNEKTFSVKAGDAVLTMPGNHHGIKQTGEEPLVIIINYIKKKH